MFGDYGYGDRGYFGYGGRRGYSGDLRKRDAQLQGFHRELFLATVKGDKHLITSIKKKIQKCGQSTDPIDVGTRRKKSPRKSKKSR